MAFGFTPKFEQSLDLNGLDPEHYLVIALDVAKQLEWNINYTSKSGFIAKVGGGLFKSMERFTVIVQDTSVALKSENMGSGMYDWGKNEKHVEDFMATFDATQSSLSETELEEKINEVMPPLRDREEDALTAPPKTTQQKFQDFFSFFKPREGYYITPMIIDINILVFILMVISGVSAFEPTTSNLISWGANLRGITLSGQWWRLITNTFLHIGIFHILLNMYALIYIGLLLEPYLGKLRFTAAYLFTGILASLTSIFMHPLTVSAGASGAIFGMYGVFLAMLTTNIIDKKARTALLTSIGVFVVLNLMNGMKAGIDNAAHIGGLISGLIIGYAYYPGLKKPSEAKISYLTVGLLFIAVSITSVIIYHKIPNDIAIYNAKIEDFSKREAVALEVFKMKNEPDSAILSAIKDKGLVNWNASVKLLDQADKLDVPQTLKYRIALLKQYCNLRIVSYGLIYKAIKEKENTKQYKPSIDSCNKKIQTIIDTLKKQ
jgi:rhomboid protease GluP